MAPKAVTHPTFSHSLSIIRLTHSLALRASPPLAQRGTVLQRRRCIDHEIKRRLRRAVDIDAAAAQLLERGADCVLSVDSLRARLRAVLEESPPLFYRRLDIYSPIHHYIPIPLIEGRCLEAS